MLTIENQTANQVEVSLIGKFAIFMPVGVLFITLTNPFSPQAKQICKKKTQNISI
jgi:hypothetical protein